jgi:hypothetical protein
MANNILKFSMNRSTSVEAVEGNRLVSVCRLRDLYTDAEIRLTVQMPDLAICEARGYFRHAWQEPVEDLDGLLQNLLNVRVGAGMLKIIKGLLGESEHLHQVTYMVEEACHGVILSLTRKVLLKAPDDLEGKMAFFSAMVEKSIRLYDRCAAFAKGGPLVRGYEKKNP